MNNMQLTIESSTTSMDLNDHQTGIYLVPELDGMTGLPEIRTSSGVNAGYDGGWTSAQNYDARLITIRGVIAHPVVSTVETIRRQLVSLVGQGRKEALTLRLTTEAGNVYTVFVRTIACTMALQRVLTSQEFQIQFRADDPLIYDDGASSGTAGILRVQRALGGFEINFNLPLFIGGGSTGTPIENGGSETVYPIINLYGPLHSPTVINSTTNQQMQILADLAYENNWQTPATASGSSFQITGIEGAPLTLTELKGNATQNGTPTPDAPVAVNTTTGENVVKITGKNLFDVSKNEINLGKNLFDKSTATQNYRLGSTGDPFADSKYYLSDYISVAQNTAYYISGVSGGVETSAVCFYASDKSFIFRRASVSDWYTFTTPANTAFLRFTTLKTNSIDQVQLERGSTATSYAPYFTPIELAKIGTYQDRIYKSGDDWFVRKEIGKAVIDGSVGEISMPSANRFNIDNAIADYSKTSDAVLAISDKYEVLKQTSDNASFNSVASSKNYAMNFGSGTAYNLRFKNTDITTIAGFEAELAGNPTTVYYALATPTTTEITDSTLLSQLNFIANLYGGTNNIMLAGTGAQGEIGVEYMTEHDVRRDVAVVDSQARTITINGSDAYHLKADGSEFITIAPGTNDMSLTSAQTSDEGYAEIKYKQGYLSI